MRSLDCASNGTPGQVGFRPSTTLRISAGGSDAAKTPQLVKDPVLLLLAPEGTAIGKILNDSFRLSRIKGENQELIFKPKDAEDVKEKELHKSCGDVATLLQAPSILGKMVRQQATHGACRGRQITGDREIQTNGRSQTANQNRETTKDTKEQKGSTEKAN
jgi:hypothetical protein